MVASRICSLCFTCINPIHPESLLRQELYPHLPEKPSYQLGLHTWQQATDPTPGNTALLAFPCPAWLPSMALRACILRLR